jgi:uncharacterized protein (TIGR03118 family)
MHSHAVRNGALALTAVAAVAVWTGVTPAAADRGSRHHGNGAYSETVVVADEASVGAPVTDPGLVNPWGIAFGPTTPLWTSNNGTSTSTLYVTNPAPAKAPLTVATQVLPTGIVFNDTDQFTLPDGTASRFLFDSLGGELSAWGGGTQTTMTGSEPGAAFTGLALVHTNFGPFLLAADAASTNVDIYNGEWHKVGSFSDPHVPSGLTTYNVAVIGNKIYVSYAPPPGVTARVKGVVDRFNIAGEFEKRLITGGKLDGPWGMVLAPTHWGRFGGALLVGNEDGGQINAYSPRSGRFLGTLRDKHGDPIGDDGLWGMAFGNGTFGTPDQLIIAIGTDEYQHGEVRLVSPVTRHSDS